jgi:hypothetical protein
MPTMIPLILVECSVHDETLNENTNQNQLSRTDVACLWRVRHLKASAARRRFVSKLVFCNGHVFSRYCMLEWLPFKWSFKRFLRFSSCRDLYYRSSPKPATRPTMDIEDYRTRFPGMLTFWEFLQQTNWGDSARMYDGGFRY